MIKNKSKIVLKLLIIFLFLILFLFIGFIFVCNFIVVSATKDRIYDSIDELPTNKTCLILGTSSKIGKNLPNPHFVNRINAAVEVFKNGKAQFLLVSGDNRTHYYNEPRDMTELLLKEKIPKKNIFQDYAGLRTLDSVFRAKLIFNQSKLTIVTDKFHLSRALFIAKHNNIDAVGYPCKKNKNIIFKTIFREYLARVKAIIDLFILNTQPHHGGKKIKIK